MPYYDVATLLALTPPDIANGAMGTYSLTEKDMRVALALFRQFRPRRVLEFGVCEGHTAKFLLQHCPFIEIYVGVDLIPEKFPERGIVPKEAGILARRDDRFDWILTDETVYGFHSKLQAHFAPEGFVSDFDAIILDANHEDWATKRDSEACAPYMRYGGLWLWHDYDTDARPVPMGHVFSLKTYLDQLVAEGRPIHLPKDENRDPWTCCSLAWEIHAGSPGAA